MTKVNKKHRAAPKNIAVIAPHFVPSNLTSVHRTRMWVQHLHEFGWCPYVITTHHDYYQDEKDWSLEKTLADNLVVVQTRAATMRPFRLIGDLGIRSWPWYVRAVKRLHAEVGLDFVHITIPSCFASIAGPFIKRHCGIPFGIDYIDPWVHESDQNRRPLTKAWLSNQLGRLIEPWVVRSAGLVTGVSKSYYADVIKRNPHIINSATFAEMPYGVSTDDFHYADRYNGHSPVFRKSDEYVNWIYPGALLPHGHEVMRSFLEAINMVSKSRPELTEKLRVHFIGTGDSGGHETCGVIEHLTNELSLNKIVRHHPDRLPYLSLVKHLIESDLCLIIGGIQPYYTPSKIHQIFASGKPALGILHSHSAACSSITSYPRGHLVSFTCLGPNTVNNISQEIENILNKSKNRDLSDIVKTNSRDFQLYTSRDSTRALVTAVEASLQMRQN